MKTSKSDIIGLHEVGFQDATKGNSYLLDTSVMLMDCEESETNSLTNKSSVPGSKQLFSLRYNEMYINFMIPLIHHDNNCFFLFHILFC